MLEPHVVEFLYTLILQVNLFAFAYRLFHEDFSPINEASRIYMYFTAMKATVSAKI